MKNELAAMDSTGDTKTLWDPRNEAEVDAARLTFDSLRKRGYLIYTVGKDGEKNKAITTFDAKAEKMIAVPPVIGG